jgi:hypothetical protein
LSDAPGAFAHLPAAVRQLLPEIETLDWPREVHADCDACPMIGGEFGPWGFSPETRCCTAQPALANFLAGRALRRGGIGRERVLARLADPGGVTPWGIDAPPEFDRRYVATLSHAFGRDRELRCPFWVGGDHTCGIWHDRSAVCRTWYCKHEDGAAGAVAWSRMQLVMSDVESRLAVWAIAQGDPPEGRASPARWARWFEEAAALVDAAPPEEIATLATDGLARYRREVGEFVAVRRLRRARVLADVLVPSLTETGRADHDHVLLTGYSSFDAVRAPKGVFELLSRLDGTRTWRAALDEARAALAARGAPIAWLDEGLVRELHRVSALRDPAGTDDLPYQIDVPDQGRWSQAAEKIP